jgi:hypothetical protein
MRGQTCSWIRPVYTTYTGWVNTWHAEQALKDVDLILWVLDASEALRPPTAIAETVKRRRYRSSWRSTNSIWPAESGDFSEHITLIEHQPP